MTPIKFKGHNIVFGENQPEYQPLPALRLEDGEVLSCWQISDEELELINKSKCIYLSQLTFNSNLQPILPMADLEQWVAQNTNPNHEEPL